ncbi:MAG TPA: L-threonylcarbamoyladenylate synthase [Aquabacterium sp.]|uniref:L-threonylcarbamoyladenylate synthase n=1 Tax=Aquabacterium sp. TaxID=1872578 RepID=UPI002E342425|nr:L-threonylcarbamoyladenylate synthase [Aquabacterium sp.]HEX5373291.1 L-threonylcarbamoyladenylate synthase [Aquabacterium sp.]
MTVPKHLDPGSQRDAIDRAAARLADGHLVAFPTETVYGLGARADDDEAVAQIFQAKGRPSHHPLIVHVHHRDAALAFASALPPVAQRLMERFWPGPLTVIVPRNPAIGAAAAGGQDTIGLRCPDHPVALALLRAAAEHGVLGVAAPSANRFGRISPTRAEHVLSEFEHEDLWVLDGGMCEVGIESAIVDCSREHPVLLRPGQLTRDELEAAACEPIRWSRPEAPDPKAPRASGTLLAHYAPRAKVRLMSEAELIDALDKLIPVLVGWSEPGPQVAVYSRSAWAHRPGQPGVAMRVMPAQPAFAAHELFADLRDMDALGVEQIWVEHPPADAAWDGVLDRLMRAAAA